jgi:hypothetical protein
VPILIVNTGHLHHVAVGVLLLHQHRQSAMLPFFGEINAVVGAVGYIPLDVVIPVVMYNMALAVPRGGGRWSPANAANVAIMVVFIGLGVIGTVALVRKLAINAGRFKLFSNGLS